MVNMQELEKNHAEAIKAAEKATEALRQGRQAQAGAEFPRLLEAVKSYGPHWTKAQQAALGQELGLMPAPAKAQGKASGKTPGKKKDPAKPYYQLDTGETCSEKSGKFKKEWAGALNAAIAKAGGRDKLPRFPNPKAPK